MHKTYISICHGELPNNSGVSNSDLVRYENDKHIIEKTFFSFSLHHYLIIISYLFLNIGLVYIL